MPPSRAFRAAAVGFALVASLCDVADAGPATDRKKKALLPPLLPAKNNFLGRVATGCTIVGAAFCPTGSCAASSAPVGPKNTSRLPAPNCPLPYPDLDMLQDETIGSEQFASLWPQDVLNGKWYVIAAADEFQPVDEYKCTHYEYNFGDLPRTTWISFDIPNNEWKKVPLQGMVVKAADGSVVPGGYRETPLRLGEKSDPWFVPIVHYTSAGEKQDILVKWGCTKPPQGNVNFVEVLSREPKVDYTVVIEAVSHLMQEGDEVTPVIEFLRPVSQDSCQMRSLPWGDGGATGTHLCRGPECDENAMDVDGGGQSREGGLDMGADLCKGPDCSENRKGGQTIMI